MCKGFVMLLGLIHNPKSHHQIFENYKDDHNCIELGYIFKSYLIIQVNQEEG